MLAKSNCRPKRFRRKNCRLLKGLSLFVLLLVFIINFVKERHIVKPDKICRFRDLKFAACEQTFDVDDADEIAVFDGAFACIFLE